MRFAMIVGVALVAGNVRAAEWEVISITNGAKAVVEIDASSVATVGKLKKAWFRWTYTEDQTVPASARSDYSVDKYSVNLSLEYFNCAERTSATVQTLYRDSQGEVVGSQQVKAAFATYSEVVPESVGETMLERICRTLKPKPAAQPPASAKKPPAQ